MRFPWLKMKDEEATRTRLPESLHILTEYILDSRLGDAEKAELTAIYRSLHSVPSIVVPS